MLDKSNLVDKEFIKIKTTLSIYLLQRIFLSFAIINQGEMINKSMKS